MITCPQGKGYSHFIIANNYIHEEDKKELEFEKKMSAANIKTMEDQIKELEISLALARKEAEAANKKAQELAVRVIESGYRMKAGEEGKKED